MVGFKHTYTPSAGLLMLCMLCATQQVSAQTGVSDDRVSLPEGPGSLEGVGENVAMDPNMGNMSYFVPIDVPQGFSGATPALGLAYNSGGGNGVLGMGWSIDLPSVERMTYRKLPRYTLDDDFAFGGGDQLVRMPSSDPPIYRSRYEKSFVRYTWMQAGQGNEGYWVAEWPDGSTGYFGADAEGNLVSQARVGDADGTFRYMLVEKVDVYGHKVEYSYIKDGHVALVSHIGYVFADGANPTYEVTFAYDERASDGRTDYLSDAKGGFNERLTKRMSRINVFSRGIAIRRYNLNYAPYGTSGGFTRLVEVVKEGVAGMVYPINFRFEYSQALGGACNGQGQGCAQPFMTSMGNLGVNLGSGRATLIDINGDALPDVLDTTEDGAHRFFLNIAADDGTASFDTTPIVSNVAAGATYRLGTAGVQVMDVNGDGFTDLLKATAAGGSVLLNQGQGDWDMETNNVGVQALAEAFVGDFEDGELQSLKFIDYNNDKLIDVMRSTQSTTTVFENGGADGFTTVLVEPIGVDFAVDGLQFADMNGDGLLDVVRVQAAVVSYRINKGWGAWEPWVEIRDLPIREFEIPLAELEDLNGDGLADLVVVGSTEVKYALNTNTNSFAAAVVLTSNVVDGELPTRDATTTIVYADMNGNGSSDVVWIDAGGEVHALELFPVRPNLLTRITNGIGMVTDITYEAAVTHMARDGGWDAWQYKLPYPMLVVSQVDKHDLLTGVHEITDYSYHDGFYDGVEKQFRGFERVETTLRGDASQEEGLTLMRYDVGAVDPYFNGLLVEEVISSGERELSATTNTYEACEVAEVAAGTEFPVRHICLTGGRTIIKEGLPASEWVVHDIAMDYDGYGNVITSIDQGVTRIGGQGCAPCGDRDPDTFGEPCGAQCLGDEIVTEADFVSTSNTNGRWITGAAYETRTFGRADSPLMSVSRFYYDGFDFEGLPLGQLSEGKMTRVTQSRGPGVDAVIQVSRKAFDQHGNVIETLDPNATVDGNTHRRRYSYSDDGLRVVRSEILLEDPEGTPYRLRNETQYEQLFDKVIESSQWMFVDHNGQVLSSPRNTTFLYDEFGRLMHRVSPGQDSAELPTDVYTYDLQSPASRIVIQKRTEVGGALDQEVVRCLDGRGRFYQDRYRLDDGRYQVSGFVVHNVRSQVVRVYQPYQSDVGTCDMAVPEGVLFEEKRFDATGRLLATREPDEAIYGTASEARLAYRPLETLRFDAEDNDPNSPHFNTPTIARVNGRGQMVALSRLLTEAGEPAQIVARYDSLGRLVEVIDPGGHRKTQEYDLLGRVTRVVDPNSAGEVRIEYDDVGNVLRTVDDRGIVTLSAYDGMNRKIAYWDEADPDGTRIQWRFDRVPDCARCTNTEGHLGRVTYPDLGGTPGLHMFGYDQRGRQVHHAHVLRGFPFVFDNAFDNVNRITSTDCPDESIIAFDYDSLDRLVAIAGVVEGVTYNTLGLAGEMIRSNGVATSATYDELLRKSTSLVVGTDGATLQGFGYSYDRNSNILAIDDLADAPRVPFAATFSYDAWYRLLEANQGDSAETLTYDLLDNITSQAGKGKLVGDYTYGSYAPNALTRVGEMVMEYDDAGHMNKRGGRTMTWDFMERMTEVSEGGTAIANFVYGVDKERVVKQEGGSTTLYPGEQFEVRDGISALYITVGSRRIARFESDILAVELLTDHALDNQINAGDAWVSRLNNNGGTAPGALLWSSVRRLMVDTGPEDGITHLHHDHLGSITMATEASAQDSKVVGQRAYSPLGEDHAESWGYVDEYGFTGQELDRSTGFYHFLHRYYDPQVGRWLSIDPLFAIASSGSLSVFGESTTAYAYVANNMINSFDATGLDGQSASKPKSRAKQRRPKKNGNVRALKTSRNQRTAMRSERSRLRRQREEASVVWSDNPLHLESPNSLGIDIGPAAPSALAAKDAIDTSMMEGNAPPPESAEVGGSEEGQVIDLIEGEALARHQARVHAEQARLWADPEYRAMRQDGADVARAGAVGTMMGHLALQAQQPAAAAPQNVFVPPPGHYKGIRGMYNIMFGPIAGSPLP